MKTTRFCLCRSRIRRLFAALLLGLLTACGGGSMPEGAEAVRGFELQRYLGTWYEIARLDHSFERGLTRVSAAYSLRDDGGVRVINRGYDRDKGRWNEAEGRAYFVESPDIGRLKVSFFGPFYGAYNIIALDREDYGYAMVIGNDTRYLWVLAREPRLDPAILSGLLKKARALGFETDRLIYPQPQEPGA